MNDSPSATRRLLPPRSESHRWFVGCFYLAAGVASFCGGLGGNVGFVYLLGQITLSAILANWAISDARQRGVPIPLLAEGVGFLPRGSRFRRMWCGAAAAVAY